MVVLVTQEFQVVSREDAEEGSKRLNTGENPPAGLIAHVLTDIPGGIRAVDIWESSEFSDVRRGAIDANVERAGCRSAVSPWRGLVSPRLWRRMTSLWGARPEPQSYKVNTASYCGLNTFGSHCLEVDYPSAPMVRSPCSPWLPAGRRAAPPRSATANLRPPTLFELRRYGGGQGARGRRPRVNGRRRRPGPFGSLRQQP